MVNGYERYQNISIPKPSKKSKIGNPDDKILAKHELGYIFGDFLQTHLVPVRESLRYFLTKFSADVFVMKSLEAKRIRQSRPFKIDSAEGSCRYSSQASEPELELRNGSNSIAYFQRSPML
jgi:hypothetical protein